MQDNLQIGRRLRREIESDILRHLRDQVWMNIRELLAQSEYLKALTAAQFRCEARKDHLPANHENDRCCRDAIAGAAAQRSARCRRRSLSDSIGLAPKTTRRRCAVALRPKGIGYGQTNFLVENAMDRRSVPGPLLVHVACKTNDISKRIRQQANRGSGLGTERPADAQYGQKEHGRRDRFQSRRGRPPRVILQAQTESLPMEA